jgi:predicted nucleotidyltransferase
MDNLIFKALVGSQAYNLAVEGSDHDYRGAFLEATNQLLGSRPLPKCTHFPGRKDDTIYPFGHSFWDGFLCRWINQ